MRHEPIRILAWVGGWMLCLAMLLPSPGWAAEGAETGAGEGALRPDPYAAMHAVEIKAVVGLQKLEGLGRVMQVISDLGPGKPMLALIAVLLCLANPRLAGRLTVMLIVCLWLRELLAMALQSPRPYWIGEGVRTFRDPPISGPTFGLPSGHATAAAAFWLFMAAEVRRVWAWGLAAGIIVAVCLSRVYLGLHFVSDVVLGVIVGSLWMVCFRTLEPRVIRAWTAMPMRRRLWSAIGVGLGVVVLSSAVQALVAAAVPADVWPPYGVTARLSAGFVWSAGTLTGMALAWVVPVGWSTAGDTWRWRWTRLALAAAPAVVYLWRPDGWRLNALLPEQAVALKWAVRFVTGTFMGWAAFFLLPSLFVRWGLTPPVSAGSGRPGSPVDPGHTSSCPEDGVR